MVLYFKMVVIYC